MTRVVGALELVTTTHKRSRPAPLIEVSSSTTTALLRSVVRRWPIAQRTGARVLTLYYEDYSADPRSAIGAVKEFLDVRDSARPLTRIPEIVKQRDATSTEWVRRFTRDLAEHNCTTSAKEEELEYATVKA